MEKSRLRVPATAPLSSAPRVVVRHSTVKFTREPEIVHRDSCEKPLKMTRLLTC